MACYAGGRLSRTKYIVRNTPERVTVTRAHHPLQGQAFEVLMSGEHRLTIRIADGTSMHIPRGWTDADGEPPRSGANRGPFTITSLRQLLELVDTLLNR